MATIKIPTFELPTVSLDINTDLYSAILSSMGADSSKLNFVDYKPGNLPDLFKLDSSRYQALIQEPKPIFDIGDTIQSIFNKRLTELADRGKPITWSTEKLKQLEPTVGNAMFAASQIGAYMTEDEASSLISSGIDQGLTGPGIMQAVIDAVRLKIDDVSAFNAWSEVSGGASPGGIVVPTSISTSESAYAPLVNEVSKNYNLDPAVLQAIIMAESGGYAGSHNTAGEDSRGLLQLNFAGGQGSSALQRGQITDPNQAFDPRTNLSIGVPPIAQAYQDGIAQGLQGDALVAFTATHSGHPGLISTSDARIQKIINFYHTYKTKTYQSPPPSSSSSPTLTGKLILGQNFTAEALREALGAKGISPEYLNQFNQLGQRQLDATQSMDVIKQAEDMFRQEAKLTPEMEAQVAPAMDAISQYLTSLSDLGQGDKAEIDQALANLQEERKLLLEPLKPKKSGWVDRIGDFKEMVGGAFHGLPTHAITDEVGKILELAHESPAAGIIGPLLIGVVPPIGIALTTARGFDTIEDWNNVFRSGMGVMSTAWYLGKPQSLKGMNAQQQELLIKESIQGEKDVEGRQKLGIPIEKPIIEHQQEQNPIEWLKRGADLLRDNPFGGGDGAWSDFGHDWDFYNSHANMVMGFVDPHVKGIAHLVSEGIEGAVNSAAYLLTAGPVAELTEKAGIPWAQYVVPQRGVMGVLGIEGQRSADVYRQWADLATAYQEGKAQPTSDELANWTELAGWIIGSKATGAAGEAARGATGTMLKGLRWPVWAAASPEESKTLMAIAKAPGIQTMLRGGLRNPLVVVGKGIQELASFPMALFEETHEVKAAGFAQRMLQEVLATTYGRPIKQLLQRLVEATPEQLRLFAPEGTQRYAWLSGLKDLLAVNKSDITEANLIKARAKWARSTPLRQANRLKELGPEETQRQIGVLADFVDNLRVSSGASEAEWKALGEQLGMPTDWLHGYQFRDKVLPYLEGLGGRNYERLDAMLARAPDGIGEQRRLGNWLKETYLDVLPTVPDVLPMVPRTTARDPGLIVRATENLASHMVQQFPAAEHALGLFNHYIYGPMVSAVLLSPAFLTHVTEESLGRMLLYIKSFPMAVSPWGQEIVTKFQRMGMTIQDTASAHLTLGMEIPGMAREFVGLDTAAEKVAREIPKPLLDRIWGPVGRGVDQWFNMIKRVELYGRVNTWHYAYQESMNREIQQAFGMTREQFTQRILNPIAREYGAMFDDVGIPPVFKEQFLATLADEPIAVLNPEKLRSLIQDIYVPRRVTIVNPVTGKRESFDRAEDMILQVFDKPTESFTVSNRIPPRARWQLAQDIIKGDGRPQVVETAIAAMLERISSELRRNILGMGDAIYAETMANAVTYASKGEVAASMEMVNAAMQHMDMGLDAMQKEIFDLAIRQGQTLSQAGERVRRVTAKVTGGGLQKIINNFAKRLVGLLDDEAFADIRNVGRRWANALSARGRLRSFMSQTRIAAYDARVRTMSRIPTASERATAWREAEDVVGQTMIRNPLTGTKQQAATVMRALDQEMLNLRAELALGLTGPERKAATERMAQSKFLTNAKQEMDDIANKITDDIVNRAQREWEEYAPKVRAVSEALINPESRAYADRLNTIAERASASAARRAESETVQIAGETKPLAAALTDMDSRSRVFASSELRSLYTDYTRRARVDQIMRPLFPYWIYESRAPQTWFGKLLPENPWLLVLWRKYLDYANSAVLPGQPRRMTGLIPMPPTPVSRALGMDYLWLDPMRGFYLNRVNRQIRQALFPTFGTGPLANFLNTMEQTGGVYLSPAITNMMFLLGITGNDWSAENMPPFIQALRWTAEGVAGKSIGPTGPYEDYQYQMALANQAAKYRYEHPEDLEMANFKPNDRAIRTSLAAQQLFFWSLPRFKGAAEPEIRKNLELQENLTKLGIPVSTQQAVQAAGKSVFSLLNRQEERTLRTFLMPELEYYSKSGWPFTERQDPERARRLRQRDKYFTMTEAKRTAAYQAQLIDDAKLQKYREEVQAYGMSTSDPSQILDPTQWKDRHHARWNGAGVNDSLAPDETADRFMGVSQYANTLKATLGDIFAKSGKGQVMPIEDIMLSAYYAIQPPMKDGQYNYDAMYSLQDQFLNKVSPSVRTYMDSEMAKWQTPMVQEFVQARDVRDEQQKIPRYKYATRDQQELYFALRSQYDYMVAQGKAAATQGDFDTFRYWQNRARKFKAQYRILGVTLPPNPAFIEFTYAPGNWELLRDWYELPELPQVIEAEPVLAR